MLTTMFLIVVSQFSFFLIMDLPMEFYLPVDKLTNLPVVTFLSEMH